VQKKRLKKPPKRKWAFCDKQSAFPHTEDALYAYVMDLGKTGCTVSTEMLQLEAPKTSKKFNIPVTESKASYSGSDCS
jgi:hypothetical protein